MPGIIFQANCTMGESPNTAIQIEGVKEASFSTFGKCRAVKNPLNLAATAALQGVASREACIPVLEPGSSGCSGCKCIWGGVIQQVGPGTDF